MLVLITLLLFKILFVFSKCAHDMFEEIKVIADNMNENLIKNRNAMFKEMMISERKFEIINLYLTTHLEINEVIYKI